MLLLFTLFVRKEKFCFTFFQFLLLKKGGALGGQELRVSPKKKLIPHFRPPGAQACCGLISRYRENEERLCNSYRFFLAPVRGGGGRNEIYQGGFHHEIEIRLVQDAIVFEAASVMGI